jgi:flavin-dependent dehydrogenase
MRVGIVGAGPAGAHLAHELSRAGATVHLYDAREAWEKPCGGGVTSKALHDYPFLGEGTAPKSWVTSLRLRTPRERELTLAPRSSFAIYSRQELGRQMRERAVAAGAQLTCQRVEKTTRRGSQWEIETAGGSVHVDFLVGADGANSVIRRRVGQALSADNFSYGLGWHVDGAVAHPPGRVEIGYLEGLSGYCWLFPRTDHLSFGIATGYRETSPAEMRARLLAFIRRDYPAVAEAILHPGPGAPHARFYAAMIPSLGAETWDRLRASSVDEGWALIGDAAGFVDPLTGEGIYYAIHSATLLAEALTGRPADYEAMWRTSFGGELRRAATLSDRFYSGSAGGTPLLERMVQVARYHRGVRETVRDLIAGEQGYLTLKERLFRSLLRPW